MLLITLAILASVSVGMATERRNGPAAQRAARGALDLLLYVLLPIIVLTNIGRLHVTTGIASGIGLAYVIIISLGFAAAAMARRQGLARSEGGAVIVCVIVANTGYLGIPLAATLLGHDAIPAAIAYDLAVSYPMLYIGAFGVGAALGTEGGQSVGERTRTFFTRNMALPAAVLGLLLPASVFTNGIVDASHVLVYLIAPLGFYALGVTLMGEAEEEGLGIPPRLTAPVGIVLVLRNVMAPALMLGLSTLIVDVPDAYLLAAAMPCGLNALTAAHGYGLDLRITGSAVAWSTAIVLAGAAIAGAV